MSPGGPFRRPESVLVVVHTVVLDCLLLERVAPAGFWQSVTGTLEWGESAAVAAAREVEEETGLRPTGLRDAEIQYEFAILPEWKSRYAPDVKFNIEHVWYLELPFIVPIELNLKEHRDYCWAPLAVAIEKVSSWTNRAALEALRP